MDRSPAFIALARQRVPGGQFWVGSLLTAKLPPCVAVAAVGECLNYLFDAGNTREALGPFFGRVFAALAPGGPLLFDVAGPGRVPEPGVRWACKEGDDWAVLASAEEDERHEYLTRRISSFRKVGDLYRRDHEVHRLRLVPRDDVAAQLHDVGFQVEVLSGYGSIPFAPGHAGVLARKPA